MNKFLRVLGYVWCSPVTAVGLAYALLFCAAGWYRWWGVVEDALVWTVNLDTSPSWLATLWKGWGGHTVGNVVVMRYKPDVRPVIMAHELVHVAQCMKMGVFQPVVYLIIYLTLKFFCKHADAYYDNSLEVDARRGAGQLIDVVGAQKKLASKQG